MPAITKSLVTELATVLCEMRRNAEAKAECVSAAALELSLEMGRVCAEKAELHSSSVNDEGIMTMREVEQGLEVEAGGSVYLEPGGYHIMLFGVEGTLVSGDLHMLTLTFEHVGEVEVEFVIQKRDEPSGHGDAMDDEGGMTMDHGTSMDMDHGDDS